MITETLTWHDAALKLPDSSSTVLIHCPTAPFLLPRDAREAAQRHADGIPLQADLS